MKRTRWAVYGLVCCLFTAVHFLILAGLISASIRGTRQNIFKGVMFYLSLCFSLPCSSVVFTSGISFSVKFCRMTFESRSWPSSLSGLRTKIHFFQFYVKGKKSDGSRSKPFDELQSFEQVFIQVWSKIVVLAVISNLFIFDVWKTWWNRTTRFNTWQR